MPWRSRGSRLVMGLGRPRELATRCLGEAPEQSVCFSPAERRYLGRGQDSGARNRVLAGDGGGWVGSRVLIGEWWRGDLLGGLVDFKHKEILNYWIIQLWDI
jgi:hypothetical protein